MTPTSRSWVRRAALPLVAVVAFATTVELDAWAVAASTTRVSVRSNGTGGNDSSGSPSISADGRFVAFSSSASNLVGGDDDGFADVFVHDRETGATRRVSLSSSGEEGNSGSYYPSISADGRFVAFQSYASNLIGADTNGAADIFVRDRETGRTRRVTGSSDGAEPDGSSYYPSISADGRFVAFDSEASNLVGSDINDSQDVFVYDRETGRTRRVSAGGNGDSGHPSISADGRFVAFESGASNLIGADTNGFFDVFVYDRETGRTRRVSVSSDGIEGNQGSYWPSISADGRSVAFYSDASSLVGGDTNGYPDVFVHHRGTGVTRWASLSSNGTDGNEGSYDPWISADGRSVTFSSDASDLVGSDTNGLSDVFIRDLDTGRTRRLSLSSDGTQGDGGSFDPKISADGRFVVFRSGASNLVAADANAYPDIFVRGPLR